MQDTINRVMFVEYLDGKIEEYPLTDRIALESNERGEPSILNVIPLDVYFFKGVRCINDNHGASIPILGNVRRWWSGLKRLER